MSTNLEYRARESRPQASEAQWQKGRQRSRARFLKKIKKTFLFFPGRTTWTFCSSDDKMRNASGHQCKVKMSGSEKKVNENTYISSIKRVTKTFLEVSHCRRAKQQQRKVQKWVVHVQSCFFLLIRPINLVDFIARRYTILYFVWTNCKYYRELRF